MSLLDSRILNSMLKACRSEFLLPLYRSKPWCFAIPFHMNIH